MTFKTVFSAEYQMSHFKEPVYQILADTRLESDLSKSQTISRSYASDVQVNTMGGDGGYSTQAVVDTAETLTVNYEKEASIYIKTLDDLQAHLPVKQKYGRKLANALVHQIDGDVLLVAYQGAGTTLTDGDFGGTSGNGVTLTASNIATVFTTAMQKLRLKNVVYNNRFQGGMKLEVPEGMPIAIISPEMLTYIELYLGGKDTLLGDQVSRNGYSGYFMGFNLFVSNSLAWTATLDIATIPTAADTIVINGVTMQAAADNSATNPGDYSIQTTNDLAMAELVALINGTATYGSDTSRDVSTANRRLLSNITASYSASADQLTLTSAGWGTVVVSETFTPAADIFTVGKQCIHPLFALSKSVSLVVQKEPALEVNFVSAKIGRDYIAWTAYGIKVFVDQAPQIVALSVNSAAFTAAGTNPK